MKDLLRELKKLNLPKDKFAIFGSGPLAIRGLRKVRDLDIIVTTNLWKETSKKFPVEDMGTHKRIVFGDIEILSKPVLDFSAEKFIKRAEVINGVRFVTLEDTLAWKARMGREKDKKDIKLVEEYLDTLKPPKKENRIR